MSIVIDASLALAWCFDDEATPQTMALFRSVGSTGAAVPTLWRLEVANVLRAAERRNRIAATDVDARLRLLRQLPIETDTETGLHAWSATLALARRHTLTVYDASYLELAIRRQLPLATLDRALARAAAAEGVSLALP